MSAKVHLHIKGGPKNGTTFTFTEHDTFIFGRMPDCHACIPDDTQVSRHHFILEANPPAACLRDLGSLNGTWVNGVKFGAREKGETPELGAKRRYPEVVLKSGDIIKVGKTSMEVSIEAAKEPQEHRIDPELADISQLSPEQLARLIFGKPEDANKAPKLQIPGYEIQNEIGRGGFGAVYRARRKQDNAAVAIKLMLSRIDADDVTYQKFKREVDLTRQLQHPNIVQFVEHGSDGTVFYFIMEYCDGGNVRDLMGKNGGRLSITQAKPIILQALEGLAFAHEKDVVHRDLKPQNILINKGVARISDFGLSKNFQQAGLSGMSMTGNYAGSPQFMAREQITNFKYVKPVSDVWSMGVTIYLMLTGAFPLPFDKKRDPIDVILNEEMIPIRKRDASISVPVGQAVDRALCGRPKERYQSAGEMLLEFKKALA